MRAALLHYECYDAYPRNNYADDVHCRIMLVVFTLRLNIKNCGCLPKCSSVITYVFLARDSVKRGHGQANADGEWRMADGGWGFFFKKK